MGSLSSRMLRRRVGLPLGEGAGGGRSGKRKRAGAEGPGDSDSDSDGEADREERLLETPRRKKLKSTSKYIYQTLFLNGENSDIKICALGEEWNLHKIYLCQMCLQPMGSPAPSRIQAWSLRAIPPAWREATGVQLPSCLPGLHCREVPWVRGGFSLALRAASSKPQWERGVCGRWENPDLPRVCRVLPDPCPGSAVRLSGGVSQCMRETPRDSLVADVGTGRAFPAPSPDPALELNWRPKGRRRPWPRAERGKSPQQTSEVLMAIARDMMKAAQDIDSGAMGKEVVPEAQSQPVPFSADNKTTSQSDVVPVLPKPGEAWHAQREERFPLNPGAEGRSKHAMSAGNIQTLCIEGAAAILGSIIFGMLLCWAISLWRTRRKRKAGQSRTSRYTSLLDNQTTDPTTV